MAGFSSLQSTAVNDELNGFRKNLFEAKSEALKFLILARKTVSDLNWWITLDRKVLMQTPCTDTLDSKFNNIDSHACPRTRAIRNERSSCTDWAY